MRQFGVAHEMILGGLTVACYNIATVNMMMAVGERKNTAIILICHSFLIWGFES